MTRSMNRTRSIIRAHPVRDERGVTLAEILIATFIISVGLVGLAMVIPLSSYGVHEGNALSTATFLAEQKLEEVRNATWYCSNPDCSPLPLTRKDCLGVSANDTSAPTSTTCTRTATSPPSAVDDCTTGATCTTYEDESSTSNAITGYSNYSRTVRIWKCSSTIPPNTSAGCAGVSTPAITADQMRLVRVTVSYTPISAGPGAVKPSSKSAVLEMIIAQRQ